MRRTGIWVGAIEIRYSAGNVMDLNVRVNDVLHTVTLANPGNDPVWRHTNWLQHRIENVLWNAGTANTVEFSSSENFPNISIDGVVITTPTEQAPRNSTFR